MTLFEPILDHIVLGWVLGVIAEFILYFAVYSGRCLIWIRVTPGIW